jgi:hypothetical protein
MGGMSATDDYAAIAARLREIRRDKDAAIKDEPKPVTGECHECRQARTPCNGACWGN